MSVNTPVALASVSSSSVSVNTPVALASVASASAAAAAAPKANAVFAEGLKAVFGSYPIFTILFPSKVSLLAKKPQGCKRRRKKTLKMLSGNCCTRNGDAMEDADVEEDDCVVGWFVSSLVCWSCLAKSVLGDT